MFKGQIVPPEDSALGVEGYREFLEEAYRLLGRYPGYLAPGEDINSLELAHLIPGVKETVIAIYLGINDAVCNKGLVTPFLVRHGHNNVFVFDAESYSGGSDVPAGTIDAREILTGFLPPNESWDLGWTYVMAAEAGRGPASLWGEKGYIDTICAKFEDFTVLTESSESRICIFIDGKAFEHPVNKSREYLIGARRKGEGMASEFGIPEALVGEFAGLEPVILERGEKLYVATTDFGPCAHGWSNIHADNEELAVVNENSAVPLDLIVAKPAVKKEYAARIRPAKGSADLTTDWFYRGADVRRVPIIRGLFEG